MLRSLWNTRHVGGSSGKKRHTPMTTNFPTADKLVSKVHQTVIGGCFSCSCRSQIIFAVGTQLQAILTKMAIEIMERHVVIQGIPLAQASDTLCSVSECFSDYTFFVDLDVLMWLDGCRDSVSFHSLFINASEVPRGL
ncbi:uncharacterized protein [Rutidosis leptorrhynchoides]|uniref:uncharacterized protein isoform X2 n=1 Tax=Rutidosis leptorrhynchoides TaxID=125765 RepID=UPI003A991A0B